MKRLLAFFGLRREDYVRQAVEAATISAQHEGYRLGLAHGELIGREKLALEIERAFGADNYHEMTAADAYRIRVSQQH